MNTSPTRLVVIFVGLTLLGAVAGIIGLAATGNPVPDVLQNIAIGSVTGLLGILVPGRAAGGDADNPVHVEAEVRPVEPGA